MKAEEAIEIIKEMQKWRRGEEPYDVAPSAMPYTPNEFGCAIDCVTEIVQEAVRYTKDKKQLVYSHSDMELAYTAGMIKKGKDD